LDIAKAAGARVIQQDWLGYGRQKQLAVSKASKEWVLCVDADERVTDTLRASIESALTAPQFDAYQFRRCNRFLRRWLRHGEGYPDWSLRLFDRRRARWSEDPIHEKVVADGSVGRLDGDLLHESAESIHVYLEKQNLYTTLQAEQAYRQGRRPSVVKMLFGPVVRFLKFYFLRLGFLDGVAGLVHILIGCVNTFLKQAKLFALTRAGNIQSLD